VVEKEEVKGIVSRMAEGEAETDIGEAVTTATVTPGEGRRKSRTKED